MKKRMNIMTSADNNIAKYLFVNLANISEVLTSKYDVHFYLLQKRIESTTLTELSSYSEQVGINFFNIELKDDEFLSELTKYAYFDDRERFYDGVSHLFLPSDINRCLYIDTGDVLFLSSDYPFYDEDFNGKSLLATTYWGLQEDKYNFKSLEMWGGFNSGHVLFNIERLRKLNYQPQDYVDYVEAWNKACPDLDQLYGGDQAFLTGFFAGDIHIIEKNNPYNIKVSAIKKGEEGKTYKSVHLNDMYKSIKPWHIPFDTKADMEIYHREEIFNRDEIDYIALWWDLCKKTPVYENLKKESFKIVKKKWKTVYDLYKEIKKHTLIISLTSYPARTKHLHLTIDTLINQSKRANKLILWLSKKQFPSLERDLTPELLDQTNRGLEIRWVDDDLKPHKKYYYAIQEFPNDLIITVDDDVLYDEFLVEKLYKSYLKFPNMISATRAHLITFNQINEKMEIAPYNFWLKDYELIREKPSMKLIPIGIGGVLYPPKTMHQEVINLDAIKRTCLKADDLWLKAMQVMAKTPTVVTKESLNVKENGVDKSTALWKENVLENFNDTQFNQILEEYNHFFGDEDTLTSRIRSYKH